MTILPSELFAPPGVAPHDWQIGSGAPVSGWGRPPVRHSEDLTRIVALPRRPPPDDVRSAALVEFVSGRMARPRTDPCRCKVLRPAEPSPCIRRLLLAQAWALHEIATQQGLLGLIGVGHGKTILDLLAPLAMPNCRTALLLIPPSVVDQLIAEYELLAEHFFVPSLVVHGRKYAVARDGMPVLHVLPYSRLCMKTNTDFIERLRPDTIIADEADLLRNLKTAATAWRVVAYIFANPRCRFCGWTGSMTDSSIRDYAHLSALALRRGSPLPLDPDVVESWASALDPSDNPADPGALYALCSPGETVQRGFHRRLVETAGVVATTAASVDVELKITERAAPPIPKIVADALRDLRNTWMRPDGEELVDALGVAKSARELASGFYYRWIFPRGEPVSLILEWLAARKAWNQELRQKLKARTTHLDSEGLCTDAAKRAWGDLPVVVGLPDWKADCWPRWRKVMDEVKPETEAVRLHDFLVRDAVDWAVSGVGVVWYDMVEFGEWVAELSGLPLHTGGPKAAKLIARERGDRSIVASISSHGRGRNGLQWYFARQLVAQAPSSATRWEQMLGRLHRQGQKAQRVTAEFYRHTPEVADCVDTALSRARYVQETTGQDQKLELGGISV